MYKINESKIKKYYMIYGQGVANNGVKKILQKIDARFLQVDINNQDDQSVLKELNKIDVIIKSPGIPWNTNILQKAKDMEIQVITEINLALFLWDHFFKLMRPKVVAITGTNGKSSFVKFLNDYCSYLNVNCQIGGNYGISVCDILLKYINNRQKKLDFLFLELSSFQTEIAVGCDEYNYSNMRIDCGLCLNISPSHMERYQTFEEYKYAKLNLKNHIKKNGLFINGDDLDADLISKVAIDIFPSFYLQGNIGKQSLLLLDKVLNYLHVDASDVELEKFSQSFVRLPFRQEKLYSSQIKKLNQVVINDSKSTNWGSTCALLEASVGKYFKQRKFSKLFLIVGGKQRSKKLMPSKEQLNFLRTINNLKLLCFGEVGNDLYLSFTNAGILNCESLSLESLVLKYRTHTNSVFLFSPAFPSFDQFSNYIERGQFFSKKYLSQE